MESTKDNDTIKSMEAKIKVDQEGNMTLLIREVTITTNSERDGRTTEASVTVAEAEIESVGDVTSTIEALKDMFTD